MTQPASIKIGVGWQDEGPPVPEQALGKIEQLQGALSRFEGREATRAIRGVRSAVDELATAAGGLSGPEGAITRLAANLTGFGIGGAVGLAAVGGFAAIGAGIKQTLDFSNDLDATLESLNNRIATLVPNAEALLKVGQLGELAQGGGTDDQRRAAGFPVQPGVFGRLMSRLQGIIVGSLRDLANPSGGSLDFRGDAEKAFDIGTDATATGISQQAQLTASRIVAAQAAHAAELLRRRGDPVGENIEFVAGLQGGAISRSFRGGLPTSLEGMRDVLSPLRGRLGTDIPIGSIPEQPFLNLDLEGRVLHRAPLRQMDEDAAGQNAALARFLPAAARGLSTIGTGGNVPAGLLSAAAGAVGTANPIAGAGLEAGSILLKAFSRPQKVIVSDFEQTAVDKLNQTRGTPLVNGFSVVGGDSRMTAYWLSRLAGLGVTPRGV